MKAPESLFSRSWTILGAVSFFSGATALVYEITWIRLFSVLFGNSTYAISSVLAVFMGGLALGGYLFGKWIDRRARPLRVYGFLEIAIGVSALSVPYLIQWSEPLIASLYERGVPPVLDLILIRTALALSILIMPTALMGATLPVLSKCIVESRSQLGHRVGFLYGINTLGAVFGCGLTGFLLIRFLGVDTSSYLACGMSVLTGAAVLFIQRMDRPEASSRAVSSREAAPSRETMAPPEAYPARDPYLTGFVLTAFFLSGLTALSYEVLWARILGFIFQRGMSIYAFTVMLCLFLVGTGLGSLLYSRRFSSHRSPIRLFAALEILAGFSVFFCLYLASRGNALESLRIQESVFLGHLLQATVILFVPTVLFGILFPLACELTTGNIANLGTSLGRAYGLNLLGSVTGPLLTGFLLIPVFGSEVSLKILIAGNILLGAVLLVLHRERRDPLTSRLVPLLLSLAILLLVFKSHFIEDLLNREQRTVIGFREGPATSVLAIETRNGIALNVGGSVGAGTLPKFRGCTELLAYIPLFLHKRPRDVVAVGFGTGRTLGFLAGSPSVSRLDLVDISDAVFQIGREVFSVYNQGVLDDPKTTRIVDDGFNFLKYTGRRYDVISIDPFTPHTPGSARLYTKDCLEQSKSKLKPGGMVVFWVMSLRAHSKSFLTALNTFHEVFTHTTVWITPDESFLLFLGTSRPLEIDVGVLRGRFASRPELARGDSHTLRNVPGFLRCLLLDEDAVRELLRAESDGISVFTANRPNLEFLIHTDTSKRIPGQWLSSKSSISHLTNVPDDLKATLGLVDTAAPRKREARIAGDGIEPAPSGGSSPVADQVPDPVQRATVAHVTDGDSAVLTDGRRIRYLGIDCPETGDPEAERAMQLNRRLVEGKRVLLRFHGEKEDPHGRLLALVYVPSPSPRRDDRCVNVELLEHGLAWLYLENPLPDGSRLAPLFSAQDTALKQRRGIWSAWLNGGQGQGKALVSTSLRIHRRSCPSIAGLPVHEVKSLAAELRGGKSPCRRCRPLRPQGDG